MGRSRIILLDGVEKTHQFASEFARTLTLNSIIALSGELGAGKTTFIQGFLQGLGGISSMVQSPTFTYLHLYPTNPPVYHFDLYRLRSSEDFLAMGFEEYFDKGGMTVMEWPERIHSILPTNTIHIRLSVLTETTRQLEIQ